MYEQSIQFIQPINSVTRPRHYRTSDDHSSPGSGQQFAEVLARKQERAEEQKEGEKETLRRMDGLNQYDCHAVETYFLLSRNMDYTC